MTVQLEKRGWDNGTFIKTCLLGGCVGIALNADTMGTLDRHCFDQRLYSIWGILRIENHGSRNATFGCNQNIFARL